MSAKNRAETITRFSVPVKDNSPADEESVDIGSRLRHPTQSQLEPMEIDEGDDTSDFVPDDYRSDTEFNSDEESSAKRRKGKGKAKGKAKGKGKAPAKSKILELLDESGLLSGESNPRVMLISLKGVSPISINLVRLNEFS